MLRNNIACGTAVAAGNATAHAQRARRHKASRRHCDAARTLHAMIPPLIRNETSRRELHLDSVPDFFYLLPIKQYIAFIHHHLLMPPPLK
jgi:hypothetical protein